MRMGHISWDMYYFFLNVFDSRQFSFNPINKFDLN